VVVVKAPVLDLRAFFASANLIALGLRLAVIQRASPIGSGTEEILWQPVMMPTGDLDSSIDNRMFH
jgi:hypothetical protein